VWREQKKSLDLSALLRATPSASCVFLERALATEPASYGVLAAADAELLAMVDGKKRDFARQCFGRVMEKYFGSKAFADC